MRGRRLRFVLLYRIVGLSLFAWGGVPALVVSGPGFEEQQNGSPSSRVPDTVAFRFLLRVLARSGPDVLAAEAFSAAERVRLRGFAKDFLGNVRPIEMELQRLGRDKDIRLVQIREASVRRDRLTSSYMRLMRSRLGPELSAKVIAYCEEHLKARITVLGGQY